MGQLPRLLRGRVIRSYDRKLPGQYAFTQIRTRFFDELN